jgi:hypothetical protein
MKIKAKRAVKIGVSDWKITVILEPISIYALKRKKSEITKPTIPDKPKSIHVLRGAS